MSFHPEECMVCGDDEVRCNTHDEDALCAYCERPSRFFVLDTGEHLCAECITDDDYPQPEAAA